MQLSKIGDADARICQGQGGILHTADPMTESDGIDHYGKARIEEEDQSFQPRRNILQPEKSKETADIITQQSQQDDPAPLPAGHPDIAFPPAAPNGGHQVKGQG